MADDATTAIVPESASAGQAAQDRRALRFQSGMAGFEGLYKDGRMAVVHGCGYAQPFFVLAFHLDGYWHTGAPIAERKRWVGRLADAIDTQARRISSVNIDEAQSLAVSARITSRLCSTSGRFGAGPVPDQAAAGPGFRRDRMTRTPRRYLLEMAKSARGGLAAGARCMGEVQDAGGLRHRRGRSAENRVADRRGHATRLYYTSYRHNAFDTHVQQPDLHQRFC